MTTQLTYRINTFASSALSKMSPPPWVFKVTSLNVNTTSQKTRLAKQVIHDVISASQMYGVDGDSNVVARQRNLFLTQVVCMVSDM